MLKVFRRAEGRGWEHFQWEKCSSGGWAGCCSSREAGHVLGGAMLDSCLGVSET